MSKEALAVRELRALYRVSQALNASLDLSEVVGGLLTVLSEELGMQRGTLALVDPESGELAIEVAHGLSQAEKRRGRYRLGEGIMGRVLESGEPMIIPSIGAEPTFLDRTGARRHVDRSQVAFLAVPVQLDGRTVGVLSADRLSEDGDELEEDLRLLSIVAGLVAQTVRIQQMVRREKAELVNENRYLRRALKGAYSLENMVGTSPAMLAVYEQVHLVAKSRAAVLISGEEGTGKEFVAKAIHFNSERANRNFVRLSCSSLPEDLLEAELFGVDSSVSGTRNPGRLDMARGGTLFLDEVGEITPGLQAKLFRLLQEREYERVGGEETLVAEVRVVAGSHRDLARAVRDGRFRADLYYRLNVVPLHLPPLRERRRDIPLLAHHFLRKYAEENRKVVRDFSQESMELLTRNNWPGNVRELESAVERAVVMATGEAIQRGDLRLEGAPPLEDSPDEPASLDAAAVRLADRMFDQPPPQGVYRGVMDRVERVLVERALHRAGGVRLRAASLLGINRNTLYAKLDRP